MSRTEGVVNVERVEPLAGIGKLSHMMRFDSIAAFDLAFECDGMKRRYPTVYRRLRNVVERLLDADS